MKTKFINLSADSKETRKQIRMQAIIMLRELIDDLPDFGRMPYQEVTPDDINAVPYIQYTIADSDPVMFVRVTKEDRPKVTFVYLSNGAGCALICTNQEWAQWLIDHLCEIGAN